MSTYEPPIFICGLPRSGSTLLELRVAKSPGVLRLAEPLFLSPWRRDFRHLLRKRVGDLSRDENLRKMIELILTEHDPIPGITGSFWRLSNIKAMGERELQENLFRKLQNSDRSLRDIFRALIEEITRFNGCRRACVPFPVHVSYMPTLMDWFPDAKFVHITRDPRAIAMSKTNDPGGTANYNRRWPYLRYFIRKAMVGFVIVQYVQASRAHDKVKDRPNYLLVRYEDMVVEPRKALSDICSFAGITFTENMLVQSEDRAQRSSLTGELRTTADASAASKWKEVITPGEKAIITRCTRKSMVRLGCDYNAHPAYCMQSIRSGGL
jgi:hypothetical protein